MGNGPAINDIVADAFKESGEGSAAIQEGVKGIGSLPTGPGSDGDGGSGKKKKGPKHIAANVDAGSGSAQSVAAISKKKAKDKQAELDKIKEKEADKKKVEPVAEKKPEKVQEAVKFDHSKEFGDVKADAGKLNKPLVEPVKKVKKV
jgi:hypothetical protein